MRQGRVNGVTMGCMWEVQLSFLCSFPQGITQCQLPRQDYGITTSRGPHALKQDHFKAPSKIFQDLSEWQAPLIAFYPLSIAESDLTLKVLRCRRNVALPFILSSRPYRTSSFHIPPSLPFLICPSRSLTASLFPPLQPLSLPPPPLPFLPPGPRPSPQRRPH